MSCCILTDIGHQDKTQDAPDKMLDMLSTGLRISSAIMLILSYRYPDQDPSRFSKVAIYDTSLVHDGLASVTVSGACYLSDERTECSELQLGEAFTYAPGLSHP